MRVFVGECLQELNQIVDLLRFQMTGLAMFIAGVTGRQEVSQRFGGAVVQVRAER